MNNVQLIGNLTKDVEVRSTQSNKTVATFTVATSDSYTVNGEVKEQTAFINCVAWGKLGEKTGLLKKGDRVIIQGRLQTRSYEAQDGSKRYVTEVVANFVGQALQGEISNSSNFQKFADEPADIPF